MKSISEMLKADLNLENCLAQCLETTTEELKIRILEFYVELMCRSSASITTDHAELEDIKNLKKIFNSVKPDATEPTESEVQRALTFLKSLLLRLPADILIDIATSSIGFLCAYAKSLFKHTLDYSVSLACLLLAIQIEPLASTYTSVLEVGISPFEWELEQYAQKSEFLLELLGSACKTVAIGLRYNNKNCSLIIDELTNCYEKYYELFFISSNLANFPDLMKYHYANEEDLVQVLSTMHSCLDKIPRRKREELLDDDVSRMLKYLAIKTENGELFEASVNLITKVGEQQASHCITENFRAEIYAKGIQMDDNNVPLLARMMEAFDDDATLSLVRAFEVANTPAEQMETVIDLFGLNKRLLILDMFRLLAEEDTVTEIALRAGFIFKMLVETEVAQALEIREIISSLPEALRNSLSNEEVFGYLIEFLVFADLKPVALFLNFQMSQKLFKVLLEAFEKFQSEAVLGKIWTAVKCLCSNFKCELRPLCALFKGLYEQLLSAEAFELTGNGQTCCHDLPVAKLSIILDAMMYPFLDYFMYEALVIICTKKLGDPDEPSFPLFARFYVTILVDAWTQMVKQVNEDVKKHFPFSMAFVVAQVVDLAAKLQTLIPQRKHNLLQARNIAVSLTKLLHQFYLHPLGIENGKKIIMVNHPEVSALQMEQLVDFVEFFALKLHLVGLNKNLYNVEFQEEILQCVAGLVRNRAQLPNLKSLFKLVRHYREDHKLCGFLENILKAIIDRQAMADVLSQTILDFSLNSNITTFSRFHSDLHSFLGTMEYFRDNKMLKFKTSVSQKVTRLARLQALEQIDMIKLSRFLATYV